MLIGVCGAHRTGKTTVCREFSAQTGIKFAPTSASKVFTDMGYDPKADYPIETRLEIQCELLKHFLMHWESLPSLAVVDRTPVDLAGYTLADIQRSTLTAAQNAIVQRYLDACVQATNKYFGGYLMLQPGIPVKEEEGKAPGTFGYTEHINAVILGLLLGQHSNYVDYMVLSRNVLSIQDRVSALNALTMSVQTPNQVHDTGQKLLA